MSKRLLISTAIVASVAGTFSSRALSKDFFLTIGGGYDASGNQLSLERNVEFQQSVLAAKRPDNPPREVWFADGDDPHPDLQCRDPKFEETCPAARRLLAEVLGDADTMDLVYRNNEVKDLKGPADLARVKQRFEELAREVKSGDRVIIYVTAHGGRARRSDRGRRETRSDSNAFNTTLYFWNTEVVTASEFCTWLDRFPADAQVVLVMVQCYAGGFGHTIFERANASAGLSDHARCGFFAQLHDRAAAGCTPDANQDDYEEYSTYFWGALAGKSRSGKALDSADYDQNGQVSFAEAHAYAMIECNTIDVPVRTSGDFLRQYSTIGKPPKKPAADDTSKDADTKQTEYLDMTGPLSKLTDSCRPDRCAVLKQLPLKLGLGTDPTVDDVQKRLRDVKEKLAAADDKLSVATRARRAALKNVRNEIYKSWPELRAEYAPLAIELATTRGDEFTKHVEGLPDYGTLRDAKKKEDALSKASLQLEREKACCERLIETCEEAALANNLALVAPPEIVRRYEQLLTMEDGTLAAPATAAASSASSAATGAGK